MKVVLKIRKLLMFKLISKRILSDKFYYQYCYFILFGKKLLYKNPQGFNAKLQWLKVYWRKPELVQLADKFEVRKFVSETIGSKYLIPFINVYSGSEKINWEELPQKFVIKATHGSGWNLICKNKDELNKKKAKKQCKKWLNTNFYWKEKEWQYRNMKPQLICEVYLDEQNGFLWDFKLFCYHGSPEFIVVYKANSKFRNIYNLNWERVEGKTSFSQGPDIKKPENLELIIHLSKSLSSGFPFVRVDFLIQNDKIYFGELTFTPAGGMYRFDPPELDLVFGKPLKVPFSNMI